MRSAPDEHNLICTPRSGHWINPVSRVFLAIFTLYKSRVGRGLVHPAAGISLNFSWGDWNTQWNLKKSIFRGLGDKQLRCIINCSKKVEIDGRAEIRNFSSSVEKYFTSELRSIVKYRCPHSWNIFQHSKRNFVSPSGHVISFNSSLQFMTSPWLLLGIVGGAISKRRLKFQNKPGRKEKKHAPV